MKTTVLTTIFSFFLMLVLSCTALSAQLPTYLFGQVPVLSVAEMGSSGLSTLYDYPTSYHNNPLATSYGLGMAFTAPVEDYTGNPASGSIQGAFPLMNLSVAQGVIMSDRGIDDYYLWDFYLSTTFKHEILTLGYTQHYAIEGYHSNDQEYDSYFYGNLGVGVTNKYGKQHVIVRNISNDSRRWQFDWAGPEIDLTDVPFYQSTQVWAVGLEQLFNDDVALKIGLLDTTDSPFNKNIKVETCLSWQNKPGFFSLSQKYSQEFHKGRSAYMGIGLRFFKQFSMSQTDLRHVMMSAEFGLSIPGM